MSRKFSDSRNLEVIRTDDEALHVQLTELKNHVSELIEDVRLRLAKAPLLDIAAIRTHLDVLESRLKGK